MKSFTILSRTLLLLLLSFGFIACNEDEFYYKEKIDALAEDKSGSDPRFKESEKHTDKDPTGNNTGPEGSDNPDPDPTEQPELIVEDFVQNANENNKVDILWVVDNSGSMHDEQASLASNFDAFISSFVNKDVDFQMAITTTDGRAGYSGEPVTGSIEALNYTSMQADTNQFMNDFKDMIMVGTRGSGREMGLVTSYDFFQNYGGSFLRRDAFLQVIYVSDENDQSPEAVENYVNGIKAEKENAGKVKMHGIVSFTSEGQGVTDGHERYEEATSATSGDLYDIDGDFYQSLLTLGEKIVELVNSFPLNKIPEVSSIKVYVNGIESSDWVYHADGNTIKFNEGKLPEDGDKIQVKYLEKN
jgi:hypothetical protein